MCLKNKIQLFILLDYVEGVGLFGNPVFESFRAGFKLLFRLGECLSCVKLFPNSIHILLGMSEQLSITNLSQMLVKVGYLFKYLSWAKTKMCVVFLNLKFTSFVRETVSCHPDAPCPREFFTIKLYSYFSFNDLALLFYLASSKAGFL